MGGGGGAVSALDVRGLSHSFGARKALDDVSFAVEPGSFSVLLGPNGAGKTTLVSLITGLYHARRGEVRVFGRSLRDAPLLALADLGVVFQMQTLDLDLTVAENLAYHGSLHDLSRGEALERGREHLDRLGMAERISDTVRSLSGGLRRRVEIARALLHGPKLLLVDEATAGLDVAGRQTLLTAIRALCRGGTSVLWATHMLDEVEDDDPLIVLHRGTVRWAGPARDLGSGRPLADAFLQLTGERE
jgi:ABC-2 type transport system ATP-binding protein